MCQCLQLKIELFKNEKFLKFWPLGVKVSGAVALPYKSFNKMYKRKKINER